MPTNDEATVFIVDDDPAVRKSLRWLIGSTGLPVETFASGREFLAAFDAQRPGCIVLDVRMPEISGLDLQDQLASLGCHTPVLVLTGYGDVPMAVRAMKAGAVEFLQKPVADQTLLEHIQQAIETDRERRSRQSPARQTTERLDQLTAREREVLELVIEGLSSKQIGRKLGISYKTIEAHRSKVLKKMEAVNVSHLVRIVVEGAPTRDDR